MVGTRNLRACFGNQEKEVDRISKLPDELIHRIMSFLDTRYAVQTSVLSKRWIHIWKSLPYLDFNMYGYTLDKLNDLIDGVFMLRDDSDIQCFSLTWYNFSQEVTTTVSRWINTAVKRNVQEVTLELCQGDPFFAYRIPPRLLNCKSLEKLTLRSCNLYIHIILPQSMSLPQLKFMCLRGILLFDEEEISKRLFSSCPLLETLRISNCHIRTDNCQKNFTLESLSLKKFEYIHHHGNIIISRSGYQTKPKLTMLSAPNLTSFTCIYDDLTNNSPWSKKN